MQTPKPTSRWNKPLSDASVAWLRSMTPAEKFQLMPKWNDMAREMVADETRIRWARVDRGPSAKGSRS